MSGLVKTNLPTPRKVELAVTALAAQGVHGAMTQLAKGFEVSRPTVYSAAATAKDVLSQHFEVAERGRRDLVTVDNAQLQRAVVALRCIGPSSLRTIEELIPILYPKIHLSYGTIQAMTAEASERAKHMNGQADLSEIVAGAVDEMFSQGAPVLAGVDLDSGYLFALELKKTRSAADWVDTFEVGKSQGLDLKVVVKDAASGIEAGVRQAFPEAQQRDDCFHALYIMGKEHQRLERRGYGAITQVEEARARLLKSRRGDRRKLSAELARASLRCDRILEAHDHFEQAAREIQEALWFIDLDHGLLRSQAEMQSRIEAAGDKMLTLTEPQSLKVGNYLKNRAPGLACYLEELDLHFKALGLSYGDPAVRLACIVTRLAFEVREKRRPWLLSENKRALAGACILLQQHAGEDAQALYDMVQIAVQHSHRASSAIEGFNAALRPHLYVHKGVNQEFLELFRARYNLHTRRWGRHKGTSPHESLTGHKVDDWLTMLGYPPTLAAN